MKKILTALRQALHQSFLILSLMTLLLGLSIFIDPPSYAVEGINEMVKTQDKVKQEFPKQAQKPANQPSNIAKKRPVDVEAEELKKGVVEEGKVLRDLLTGTKPDGTSVFDSKQ